jgi:hypothetical protein
MMVTLIRTRTPAALREQAAQVPRLRCQLTQSRCAAQAAAAEAARLTTERDAAIAETGGRPARLLAATRDPVTGPSIQADIALRVVRDMIAEAKASGAADVIEGIRVIDALLGEDLPSPCSSTRPAASLPTAQLRDGATHRHAPGDEHR